MWEFFFCHHRHLGGLHSGDIWLGCLLFVFVIWMGLGTQSLHHWCSNCLWHFTIIVANIAGKKSAERLSAGEKSKRCSYSTNRSSGQMWPTAVKKKGSVCSKVYNDDVQGRANLCCHWLQALSSIFQWPQSSMFFSPFETFRRLGFILSVNPLVLAVRSDVNGAQCGTWCTLQCPLFITPESDFHSPFHGLPQHQKTCLKAGSSISI